MDKKKTGRPTAYKPEYNDLAFKYCLLGATDKDLGTFFGVEEQTINNWKHNYPGFFGSIKAGREEADAKVAKSLYKRATGYELPTEKVFQYQGAVVRADTVEHIPPDTGAAFIWLKNRQPEKWRDRHEVAVDVSPITFVDDLDD